MQKLRLAFACLKTYNPYYQQLEWNANAAAASEPEDVVIGVVREANNEDGQAALISQQSLLPKLDGTRAQ